MLSTDKMEFTFKHRTDKDPTAVTSSKINLTSCDF